MTLQSLQAEFAESLFADEPYCDDVQPQSNLLIYQNNLFASLTRALRNTYPLILKLVGDDFFPLAAKAYCKQYPSRSNSLDDYGAYFGTFLAEFGPTRSLIYLPEVAEFEWACHEASFAADHPPLAIETLQKVTPDLYENLHFTLHPMIRIMKCNFPILRIIELCKGEVDEEIDVDAGGDNLMISRKDNALSLTTLSDADCQFLSLIGENYSLKEALEAALTVDSEFRLDTKLPQWVQQGIIVDCYLMTA